jgi:amidase
MKRLSKEELRRYVPNAIYELREEELDEYFQLTEFIFDQLEPFAETTVPRSPVLPATRDPGRRPKASEDPWNAIVRWCWAQADADGILTGKRVALKDNIAIAGVPLTCGSEVLQGHIPAEDATVTERLLRAGAEIVAVTNMENFAMSGGGDTSHYGPILNPVDPTRTASGSSGGSAAALHYDGVDITLGTDQGGSIRLPAAWCGVLGLKPTFGLVPYTGILGIDQSYDHVGPLARTTDDLARALQAVAGRDEADPRQGDVVLADYTAAVAGAPEDLSGATLGVLSEGFDARAGAEEPVVHAVRAAVERLKELGADVKEVSVPEHLTGSALFFVSVIEGQTATIAGFGNGYHWRGRYSEDTAVALGEGLRRSGDALPPQVKVILLVGEFLRTEYFSKLYARAHNLRHALRKAYDAALETVDFLVLPTSTELPHRYVRDCSLSERVRSGWTMGGDTAVFDYTGHPALTMPAAEAGGLPVGVQIVGRMHDEARIIALARTYEAAYGWLPRSV